MLFRVLCKKKVVYLKLGMRALSQVLAAFMCKWQELLVSIDGWYTWIT